MELTDRAEQNLQTKIAICPENVGIAHGISIVIHALDWKTELPALDPLFDDRDRQRMPALKQCARDGDAEVIVAKAGDRIVGRITSHYRLRNEMGWLPDANTERFQSQGNAYIETLMVQDGLRGKGIGKLLLDAAIVSGTLRGVTLFGLHTDENNSGARRFYEREGWKLESIGAPVWSSGSRMCVYTLELHESIKR